MEVDLNHDEYIHNRWESMSEQENEYSITNIVFFTYFVDLNGCGNPNAFKCWYSQQAERFYLSVIHINILSNINMYNYKQIQIVLDQCSLRWGFAPHLNKINGISPISTVTSV